MKIYSLIFIKYVYLLIFIIFIIVTNIYGESFCTDY